MYWGFRASTGNNAWHFSGIFLGGLLPALLRPGASPLVVAKNRLPVFERGGQFFLFNKFLCFFCSLEFYRVEMSVQHPGA